MFARIFVGLVAVLLLISPAARAQQSQVRDYLPFSMLDGFSRSQSVDAKYDFFNFVTDDSGKTSRIEGHKVEIVYAGSGSVRGSGLVILKTLESEANSLNSQILFESSITDEKSCNRDSSMLLIVFKFERSNTPVWASAACNNYAGYTLDIVEEKTFAPAIPARPSGNKGGSLSPGDPTLPASVPVAADSTGRQHLATNSTEGLLDATGKPIQAPIAPTLKETGHVQVYINFVTDSAQLQRSSDPVLNELAATLKASPDLKVDLIGHTDAVGSDAHNQDLSKRRAASVYLWLVQHGIAHDRLQSEGHGFLEPIAPNETAEGRALNRRVEVKTTG
jgi:outer membrane protein OmpA-like peptidoglycan-associated protein